MERPIPVDEERSFELHELFFSTTDLKGAIRDGNEVFARVAGYKKEELIGAPHSIIRHPDMPRSVFKLLWDYIQDGRSIAAYVKNMAADGKYYWVLAIAQPCEGGYVSIRLKPSSPLLQAAENIYKEALKVERETETTTKDRRSAMAAGADKILELLGKAGFADYDTFMWEALSLEIASRRALLKGQETHSDVPVSAVNDDHSQGLRLSLSRCQRIERQLDELFQSLDSFKAVNAQLREKSENILDVADSVRMQSLNASIEASRSGRSGNTLGAVANSLGTATGECSRSVVQLTNCMESVAGLLAKLIFGVAVAKLQSEMSTCFLHELLSSDEAAKSKQVRESLDILLALLSARVEKVYDDMEHCGADFAKLEKLVSKLKGIAKALRFVELAGQKESALQVDGEKFAVVFDEIREGIEYTKSQTQELDGSIAIMRRQVGEMRKKKAVLMTDAASISNSQFALTSA